MDTATVTYKRHRFPPQIIARAVWLYFRFPLSLRLDDAQLKRVSQVSARSLPNNVTSPSQRLIGRVSDLKAASR